MHDLVIRGGTIVDGSGAPRFAGDIAIDGGTITQVGGKVGAGKRELQADGLLVTPGWVDIHTHYDGQVTWDPYLSPSSWHGVTTVVMGNCGVGFAPVKADKRDWLIGLMEGVEDIPGTALSEGIDWRWETFPEYLDALERKPLALDVGTQVPHCAVRAYVMGERGAANEPATPEDIRQMADIVEQAMRAGALGFTTSRTFAHRTIEGQMVPGHYAGEDELLGIGRALGRLGTGVFEMASDLGLGYSDQDPYTHEMEWMQRLSLETGIPVTFALLEFPTNPDQWRGVLAQADAAVKAGANIKAQVAARPVSLLLSWESTLHPFLKHPSYMEIAKLPFAERLARLRDPALRAAICRESTGFRDEFRRDIVSNYDRMFRLGNPPNYEPREEDSIAALARREGRNPSEVIYDAMMEDDGTALLYRPLSNFQEYNLDHNLEMLRHPHSFLSLSDGGAHCGVICDASMPTFNLIHWVRERSRGERIPLEEMVHMQTRDTAEIYGLLDRGLLKPGMKADVNVIDFDGLWLAPPQMVHDLPSQGRRMIQRGGGYRYTVVSGAVTYENSEPTGELPGKLIRGPQAVATR